MLYCLGRRFERGNRKRETGLYLAVAYINFTFAWKPHKNALCLMATGFVPHSSGLPQAGGHKSRRGFKFPPARKNLSTQRASGHAGAQSALNCAARRHKLFKYIPRGKRGLMLLLLPVAQLEIATACCVAVVAPTK